VFVLFKYLKGIESMCEKFFNVLAIGLVLYSVFYSSDSSADEISLRKNSEWALTSSSKGTILAQSTKPVQSQGSTQKKTSVEIPTLIVFDMTPEKGIEKGTTNLLIEIIMDEISRSKAFKVIGQKDIDKMLFWESNKQLKNCSENSCMMQIAGAMGAEYYVESSIGTVGNSYVISMKLIETMKVEIKGRSTRTIVKDEDKLIKEVKEMVSEVLNQAGAVVVAKKADEQKTTSETKIVKEPKVETKVAGKSGKGISTGGIITTGIGVGLLAGGIIFGLKAKDLEDKARNWDRESQEDYYNIEEEYKSNAKIADYLFVGGGIVTAGGVVWMIVSAINGEKKNDTVSIYTKGDGFVASYRYNW